MMEFPGLFGSRPYLTRAIFYVVTEAGPLELATGYGAPEFHFCIADTDDLPITVSFTPFDPNLLAHLEGIGLKLRHIVSFHGILFLPTTIRFSVSLYNNAAHQNMPH